MKNSRSKKKIKYPDPNAQALWSRNKNIVFKDKKKYNRKDKSWKEE